MLVYILLVALDWPMYGKDLCNTHRQEGKGAMTSAVIKWCYNMGAGTSGIEVEPTLADINNDGYLEVIVMNYYYYKVHAFSYLGSPLWTYTAGNQLGVSCATADIDGDGYDEIMFGSSDSKVYALNHDGSFSWSYTAGGLTSTSGPKVADIDNDGSYEIIFGSYDNKLYVLNHDGSLLWSYTAGSGMNSVPAVADIDNDGFYEIIFGSWDSKLYVLNHDGSLLWSYTVGGAASVSTPAVADINSDSWNEIVFSANSKVYSLTHDGIFMWSYHIDSLQYTDQSPAIADIDGDGYDEIMTGSEYGGGGKVWALNHDGTLLWSFNMSGWVHKPCAVADVDGDGWYEIVVPTLYPFGGNELYCLNHDGTVCWTITLQMDEHDAAIGDIDGDSCLEIAVGTTVQHCVYVLDDPLNTSGCSPVGMEERGETRVKSLELRVTRDEVVFSIPSSGIVNLKLYDICGRLLDCLIETYITKGTHTVRLPNLRTGIYFVILAHNGVKLSDKLVVIK